MTEPDATATPPSAAGSARPRTAVTGASGFVGAQIVAELLGRGHDVVATVRDPSDAGKTAHLRELGAQAEGTLSLRAADLLTEGSFDEAFRGCDFVVHAAAAVTLTAKDHQRDIVDPAVRGTQNVLGAVRRAGTVRRVAMTSSIAAVLDERRPTGHIYTEADWNESATLADAPYPLAKTQAERLARRLWEDVPARDRYGLVCLNPTFVLGPVQAKIHLRSSPSVVRDLLRRKFPACPRLNFGVVDVRDVAWAHAEALSNERAEGRYILDAGPLWMVEIARILAGAFPDKRVPTWELPSLAMYAYALVDKRLTWAFLRKNLGVRLAIDHGRAERALGVRFRPLADTVLASAHSIVDNGWA